MDATLVKALQLVLSLSILVILHEGGHFFFAKLFKIKVEKFFLFFDPYFHLFSTKDKWFTRLFPKCKDAETEYGIGWLPFGGYVKIVGMIDESMDTEQMKKPVQPWEFRAKPAWQRLFVMIGGVLVNFLLALFIYVMILFAWGEKYIPIQDMSMGFQFNEQAQAIGVVVGRMMRHENKLASRQRNRLRGKSPIDADKGWLVGGVKAEPSLRPGDNIQKVPPIPVKAPDELQGRKAKERSVQHARYDRA